MTLYLVSLIVLGLMCGQRIAERCCRILHIPHSTANRSKPTS